MRHGRAGYRLGRTTAHRTSTLRNLAAGLFEHGQIVTTIPKAKAVRPMIEKIITAAKKGDLASRRRVIAKLGGDRLGFDWLYLPKGASDTEKEHVQKLKDQASVFFEVPDGSKVERNRYGELRKAPKIVKHIFDNIAPRFADRPGGYTRIVKLGRKRIGDGTELCVLQFVGAEDGAEIGGRPSQRRRIGDNRTAFYAKLKKEGAKAQASANEG
jgi:large subunit ribosomal protein L17